MAGLQPSPAGNPSSSSSGTSSSPQFTPVSYGSDDESPTHRPTGFSMGPLRVQTNFDDHPDVGDPLSDVENENDYNTSEEHESKLPRGSSAPRYTPEEESEVVRRFDRRLVPFLALLYLLAFLDRSSKSSYPTYWNSHFSASKHLCHYLFTITRYWKCENSWTKGRSSTVIFAI
jgi:hypothetical protein